MKTNRKILTLVFALACGVSLFAQGTGAASFPYALDPVKDSCWVVGDLALVGASIYLDSVKPAADPATLDASKIPFFDQWYTTARDDTLDKVGDGLVVAQALVPAVALPGLEGKQMLTLGLMYAETLGLAYGANSTIKSLVTRYRPYAYASPAPSDIGDADAASSFPSRHATLAFASAVFAGSVFDATHPDSPYRPWVWAGSLGFATAIAVTRVAAGEHFVSDVAAGAALGSLIGFGLPYLHRLRVPVGGSEAGTQAKSSLSFEASASGFGLRLAL
jgi:membrane-associated phospholipid phosphatase